MSVLPRMLFYYTIVSVKIVELVLPYSFEVFKCDFRDLGTTVDRIRGLIAKSWLTCSIIASCYYLLYFIRIVEDTATLCCNDRRH